MQKILLFAFGLILMTAIAFFMTAEAEDIHFNNNVFTLKYNEFSKADNRRENEYFLKNETKNNWSKLVGIYYYPDITNPIKFADDKSKSIEKEETNLLLKFIKNKKTDKAAISYLQNGMNDGKYNFEYNILKYEKHPKKGMMVLRYAIRYFFNSKDEIKSIATKIKAQNDEELQTIIVSPIPPIVE